MNDIREKKGLSPLDEAEFLTYITHLQLQNKIVVENGEVKPVKENDYEK